MILLGLAVAVLVLSKFIHLLYPPPEVPLFVEAPGLRVFASAEAAKTAGIAIPLAGETFGASLQAVAAYSQTSSTFPADTTNTVYAKNGTRTFEIYRLPVDAKDASVAKLSVGAAGPALSIGAFTGHVYRINRPSAVCVEATPLRPLRVCQINLRLVYGDTQATTIITVDGDTLTEGELIAVARSLD